MTKTSQQFNQRLQSVHTSVGITTSLFMYIVIFFGIFAIFLPYIHTWEKPSRHFEAANIQEIDYSKMIDPVISDPDFPQNNIIIELPGYFGDPALKINHQFIEPIVFNPKTMELIKDEGENSNLSRFLNHMHYGRPFRDFGGKFIFGFVSVAVMFLIVGGIIQIRKIKYKKKPKTNQGKFSKYHRKILTWLFAPLIIVTITGGFMNLGYFGSTLMTYTASKGEVNNTWKLVGPVVNPKRESVKKENKTVEMMPISELIKIAQNINPDLQFQKIKLINWKDSSAQIELIAYNPKMPFLNGIYNDPTIVLNAVDGSLILNKKVLDASWASILVDSFYFLHLLFGVDIFVRLLIAILMAACAIAIAFGIRMWLEKKAKKFENKIAFYHWFEKLSITVIIGVIPATGFIFCLQWLLAFDMNDRIILQQGLFFIFWLATMTLSFYNINSFKTVKQLLYLASFLFITAPILHTLNSGFNPLEQLSNNMPIVLNVNIALFLFSIVLFILAYKTPIKNKDSYAN